MIRIAMPTPRSSPALDEAVDSTTTGVVSGSLGLLARGTVCPADVAKPLAVVYMRNSVVLVNLTPVTPLPRNVAPGANEKGKQTNAVCELFCLQRFVR
jgi:hypothetical protein